VTFRGKTVAKKKIARFEKSYGVPGLSEIRPEHIFAINQRIR